MATEFKAELLPRLLREYRASRGLTQEDLADAVGISPRALQSLERGTAAPRRATLDRLAAALRLSETQRSELEHAISARRRLPTARALERSAEANVQLSALPVPRTSFFGRDAELAALAQLLVEPASTARLVTLVGPGGCGKTRLAVEAATRLAASFAAGVRFVSLAAILDAQHVLAAIAQVLGAQPAPAGALRQAIALCIGERRLLLVLDNFEQVVEAAPDVAALLAACPGLRLLVTSRIALRISGEHRLPVPPLALPDAARRPSVAALARCASVRLFCERARAVLPAFTLTDENAADVAALCRRLDGLPLALELAAARIDILTPHELLRRLAPSLDLLTGGPRDAPPRHRTLRHAIGWSYDLLEPGQRTLLRRLSVFVGGFSVEQAEALWNALGGRTPALLEGLATLVEASLVGVTADSVIGRRCFMLETIRQFAGERLAASREAGRVQRAHAEVCAALAEQMEYGVACEGFGLWAERLGVEQDNWRAALRWSLAYDAAAGLRLVGALWLWFFRHHPAEGRRWADDLLGLPSAQPRTSARGWALVAAAKCSWKLGQFAAVRGYAEEAVAIAHELDDPRLLPNALHALALSKLGDPASACALTEEATRAFEAASEHGTLGLALNSYGWMLALAGRFPEAEAVVARSTALGERLRDAYLLGSALFARATIFLMRGNLEGGHRVMEQALVELRRAGDRGTAAAALMTLADVDRRSGAHELAAELYGRALEASREMGEVGNVVVCLEGLAGVAAARGGWPAAATLLGAAEAMQESHGAQLFPVSRQLHDDILGSVREVLDGDAFQEAHARGRAMDERAAVTYALEGAGKAPSAVPLPALAPALAPA